MWYSNYYKMLQREHAPRFRIRVWLAESSPGLASLAWTSVQMSLGTGRSDAPPMFIYKVEKVTHGMPHQYYNFIGCSNLNLCHILYSRKYWQQLNLAVGPKIAIAKILADLNFSVRDRHMYVCKQETLADFNLVVAKADRQTTKFNSPPNFPAI